jgi:hypothetical protein
MGHSLNINFLDHEFVTSNWMIFLKKSLHCLDINEFVYLKYILKNINKITIFYFEW